MTCSATPNPSCKATGTFAHASPMAKAIAVVPPPSFGALSYSLCRGNLDTPVPGPQNLPGLPRSSARAHDVDAQQLKSSNLNPFLLARPAGHRSHHISLHGNCHRRWNRFLHLLDLQRLTKRRSSSNDHSPASNTCEAPPCTYIITRFPALGPCFTKPCVSITFGHPFLLNPSRYIYCKEDTQNSSSKPLSSLHVLVFL